MPGGSASGVWLAPREIVRFHEHRVAPLVAPIIYKVFSEFVQVNQVCQLATFLCQMGAKTAIKNVGVMSIAEGSVFVYTSQVCRAFDVIMSMWPNICWRGTEAVLRLRTWGMIDIIWRMPCIRDSYWAPASGKTHKTFWAL
jgi:hypothetical protein